MVNSDKKIPLLVICGPTASGKTRLAVELAKRLNGEVVSADSMQIYKGMSIATAKPTIDEMQGVPHHLIDFLEPDKAFSVADYVKLAKEIVFDIHTRGKLPIICGGTGLYISSLIDNISFDDTSSNNEIRLRLEKEAEKYGIKVILDGVFSHTGSDSIYFNREGRYGNRGFWNDQEGEFKGWFTLEENGTYKSWWGIDTLPETNEEKTEAAVETTEE